MHMMLIFLLCITSTTSLDLPVKLPTFHVANVIFLLHNSFFVPSPLLTSLGIRCASPPGYALSLCLCVPSTFLTSFGIRCASPPGDALAILLLLYDTSMLNKLEQVFPAGCPS